MGVRAAPLQGRHGRGAGAVAIADGPLVGAPEAPYRGIQPFRYEDHPIFFARDEETRLLAGLVVVYRGILLYGNSGNGKSSLVNAGLLPRAHELGFDPVRVRVQPVAGAELVVDQIAITDADGDAVPFLFAPEDDGSPRIVLSIAELEQRLLAVSDEHRPLIVFDQFEEIVTLFDDGHGPASRRALKAMIGRLLRGPLPVKLLFAFREDFLGAITQLLAEHPELVDQALRLGPPSADDLVKIIRGPFDAFPAHFAPELTPALAERLSAELAQRFGSGEVSLSEVQTVCLRLWRSTDPEALLGEKKVQGLLEDELGEALDTFEHDLRAAAVALLGQMVTAGGTRNVISAEDLRLRVAEADAEISPRLLDEALRRLEGESKLIRRERRRDIDLYEITSEFLVPWISRRREEARVEKEHRRERRRLRIFGSIAGGLLLLVALMAGVAVWALAQRSEARRQATDASSLALAGAATEPLTSRPDISLALGFEAYRLRPRAEATAAVRQALVAARASGLRAVLTGDGRQLDVAFSPGVAFWTTAAHASRGSLGDTGTVSDIAYSPDGRTVAAAGADGTLSLWNATTRTPRGAIDGEAGALDDVAFSPDGRTVAAAGGDGTVLLWTPATKALDRLAGHNGAVSGVAFSHDGAILASSGDDGTVRLWSSATGTQLARLTGHIRGISAVAFSPDGRTLASAGDIDATLRLWNTATRAQRGRLVGHTQEVEDIAFSHDGRTLASAGDDGTVRVWSRATRRQTAGLTDDEYAFLGVAFSPDGRTLAAALADGSVRLRNLASGAQTRLDAGPMQTNVVAFRPGGAMLAAGGDDGRVRLWNVADGKRLRGFATRVHHVYDIAFSPDGNTLAVAGARDALQLWSLTTRAAAGSLVGHHDYVRGVAFSPDGTTIASVSDDETVQLWDAATRRAVGRLTGHTDAVLAVAFSPGGRTLASAGKDGTIRLWDPVAHVGLGRITGHRGAVNSVAFSPDGRTLGSAGADHSVRLWDELLWRDVPELRATVCDVLLSGLSRAEWAQYAVGIPYRRSCP